MMKHFLFVRDDCGDCEKLKPLAEANRDTETVRVDSVGGMALAAFHELLGEPVPLLFTMWTSSEEIEIETDVDKIKEILNG